MSMLDFYFAFERLVEKWPVGTNLTLAQIADQTRSAVARAVDAVSTSLNQEFDVNEAITQAEAKQAILGLRDRLSLQLEDLERRRKLERAAAMRAYDLTMEKIRVLLAHKDQRTAYRTLSYLLGRHEKSLPYEIVASVCGDLIRLGSKTEVTLQELGGWLRKAVDAAVASGLPESLEDALDFLDTYREIFVSDTRGIGHKIINNAFAALSLPVCDIQVTHRLT